MKSGFLDNIQERIWENLKSNNILEEILSRSKHASSPDNYVGAKLWREAQAGLDYKYYMWIQILIEHQHRAQPVTPKLYRIKESEEEQLVLCQKIWEGVTIEDIIKIAAISAEEYNSGRRWMDVSQRIFMEKFYPAVLNGDVKVEISPKYAQYKVSTK